MAVVINSIGAGVSGLLPYLQENVRAAPPLEIRRINLSARQKASVWNLAMCISEVIDTGMLLGVISSVMKSKPLTPALENAATSIYQAFKKKKKK